MIDLDSEEGRRADRRLHDEVVIWLTTVGPFGQPQASPVWFLWDGRTLLIYSMPTSPKVANIRANPRVSVNLDGGARGEDVVTMEGRAEILETGPPTEGSDYIDKYRDEIARLGGDPGSFAAEYSTPIRVTPTRARIY